MAKYICDECGCEFDELARWEESRGEFWGIPCNETMYGCPSCYSSAVREVDKDVDDDEELEGQDRD